MAGLLIVRGEIDRVREVRAARERVMVLQSIELGEHYQLLDPIPFPKPDQAFFPRDHALYTVNGVLKPHLTMYPGEVQRWRLLNAAEGNFMSLYLKKHDFHVLAWDGLTLAEPDTTRVVMMSAGNRVDMLVRAGRPGRYDLVLTPGSSQNPDIPGMPESRRTRSGTSPGTPGGRSRSTRSRRWLTWWRAARPGARTRTGPSGTWAGSAATSWTGFRGAARPTCTGG